MSDSELSPTIKPDAKPATIDSIFIDGPKQTGPIILNTIEKNKDKEDYDDDDDYVELSVIMNSSDDERPRMREIHKKTTQHPIISIDSETGKKVYNYWTAKNLKTVRSWLSAIKKSSFTYEIIRETYSTKLNTVLLMILLISSTTTLLGTFSTTVVSINPPDNPILVLVGYWVMVSINVINFIGALLAGAVKIFKWDEIVDSSTTFIQKLDDFYATISSELVLPDKLRRNANDFIIKQNDQFVKIMHNSPRISSSNNKLANKKYKKFIEDSSTNFNCSQKYEQCDAYIDIV
jgi:hypothetical protein